MLRFCAVGFHMLETCIAEEQRREPLGCLISRHMLDRLLNKALNRISPIFKIRA